MQDLTPTEATVEAPFMGVCENTKVGAQRAVPRGAQTPDP